MSKRRAWPFEGDSPLARARKMAMAYRHVAQELQAEVAYLYDTIAKMDPRIVGWVDDPEFANTHKDAVEKTLSNEVAALDERFYEWGEEWHASFQRAYDDDELINSHEAGGILGTASNSLSRLRIAGRIAGQFIKHQGDPQGRWYYLAGDVYKLSNERRARGSRNPDSTDTVQDADEVTPDER